MSARGKEKETIFLLPKKIRIYILLFDLNFCFQILEKIENRELAMVIVIEMFQVFKRAMRVHIELKRRAKILSLKKINYHNIVITYDIPPGITSNVAEKLM